MNGVELYSLRTPSRCASSSISKTKISGYVIHYDRQYSMIAVKVSQNHASVCPHEVYVKASSRFRFPFLIFQRKKSFTKDSLVSFSQS